jgi:DNA (cytosine-5)-methyltransferase 1
MMAGTSYLSVTDMFCGAGGSSIGVVAAGAELKLAMNHWKQALETHNENFPLSEHVLGDIRTADPRRFPTTDILIASPECTAHTLAKGKKRKNVHQLDLFGNNQIDPAEERSRCTMWDVPRFAEHHRYRIIIVENVVDSCLYWEPFDAWLIAMASLGYDHQLVFLNSMFAHPTPQSRDRLYIVFWRRGNRKPDLTFSPIAWCATCLRNVEGMQAWKNPARRRGKYGVRNQYVYRCSTCREIVQPYYYAAANAIDWTIKGERIGDRKRPLKPKTMERIQYGLNKYACQPLTMRYDGEKIRPVTEEMPTLTTRDVTAFVMGCERSGTPGRAYPVDGSFPTQTGQQDKAPVVPPFLMGMHGDYYTYRRMEEAIPTQVATGSTTAMVCPPFLVSPNHRSVRATSIDEPVPTQTASIHHGLLVPAGGTWNKAAVATEGPFPTQTTREMYGLLLGQQSAAVAKSTNEPAPTVSTAGAIGLLVGIGGASGQRGPRDLNDAFPTQTGTPTYGLVGCNRTHNVLTGTNQPLRTVLTGNHHYLLVPYSGDDKPHPIEEPARTVTTHDREGLLRTAIDINDCTFRMLQPHEIQAAMGFPAGYIVRGNARDRVKQLGNAVTPPAMSLLFERCAATLAG